MTAGTGLSMSAATGAVTASITVGGVTTTEIKDATILSADIANGAVDTLQIAALAVGTAKISAGAVTAAKIAPNTITFDRFANNGCTGGQTMKIDGAGNWGCANPYNNVQPQTTIGAGLVAGGNFIFPIAGPFAPTFSGVCMVTASAQVNSPAPNPTPGPFFRVAVFNSVGGNGDDGTYGFYFPPAPAAGYSANLTRTSAIPISSANTYNFGCYVGFPDANWTGDLAQCNVSWVCY